jgi:HlyD family secretion protein
VTNFEVKILILEDSYKDMVMENDFIKSPFRPGMSATVDIQTETANNIITVPIQAVTTRSDTTENQTTTNEEDDQLVSESNQQEEAELKECVFLFEEGKAVMQEVETGIQDNMYIEIVEGLEAEQEVIVGPYRAVSNRLKDGDAVKKVDKKELFEKN